MASVGETCNSFMLECLQGIHQPGDAYMGALYAPSASLSRATTAYTATGEVPNSGTYAAGGQALVGYTAVLAGNVAYLDWTTNPEWTGATISAQAMLIYNATRANRAVAIITFTGGTITSTNGTFTVELPTPGATAAVRLRNP